jgi:hypothetical protein
VPPGERHFSTRNTDQLVLFRKIIIVYCENNIKQKYTVWAKCRDFSVKTGGALNEGLKCCDENFIEN